MVLRRCFLASALTPRAKGDIDPNMAGMVAEMLRFTFQSPKDGEYDEDEMGNSEASKDHAAVFDDRV